MTAFRRAVALSLDKRYIANDLFDGWGVPLDSYIPLTSPWSIEGMNDYDYYTSDVKTANDSLDSIRIQDIDDDGWRELPNGQDFAVNIEIASSTKEARQIAYAVQESMQLLGGNAITNDSWCEILNRVYFHGNYDIIGVPEGKTRFIFNLQDNATWSDGRTITSSDVVSMILFYYETEDHPFYPSTLNLTSVYAPPDGIVYLEFDTESYWQIYSVCLLPIMQRDSLEQIRSIDWDVYFRRPPIVTLDPFMVSNISDPTLIMRPNLQYFRRLHNSASTSITIPYDMIYQSPFLTILIIGVSATVVVILLPAEVKTLHLLKCADAGRSCQTDSSLASYGFQYISLLL